MNILAHIVDGPLPATPWEPPAGAGAVLCFEGIVRVAEGTGRIRALDYEVYEPMASRLLHSLGEELGRHHGLLGLFVEHSRGVVAVGECSFRLRIASTHRKEALAAMDAYIDRLKQDVPIWKSPVWDTPETGGSR